VQVKLKEPDFKLIKLFVAEFTNAENSLEATITTSTQKRKIKDRLISKPLSCCVAFFLNGRAGVWKDPEDSYRVRYKVKQGLL
jgi:hypothetical protein